MSKFIAFLRAINVGGHNVTMEELRGLFTASGFKGVESFIASGNVIFESQARNTKALEQKIEDQLHRSLGYEVKTFIRTPHEVADIAKYKPFPEAEIASAAALVVGFLAEPLHAEGTASLMALRTEFDDFHVHGREIYWLCRQKQSESTISNTLFERKVRVRTTFRGINTVTKLAAKYASFG